MRLGNALFFPAFALAAALTYFAYNEISLLLDPYNVVWRRHEIARDAWAIEQFRSAKIRHLAADPSRYDGVVLANSRGTAPKTRDFNRLTGKTYFNLSVSADSPYGYLGKARWIVDNQPRVKDVTVLIWWDQFRTPVNSDALIIREHPEVAGDSWISFYWDFSNLPLETFWRSFTYYLKRLTGFVGGGEVITYDGFDPETGDVTIWGPSYSDFQPSPEDRRNFDAQVRKDPPGVLRFHDSTMSDADLIEIDKNQMAPLRAEQAAAFETMIAVFDQANVKVTCIIPPMPAVIITRAPLEPYLAWLKTIVEDCGVAWDFSIPSAITSDNYNYWDWSHFLAHVSNSMMLRTAGADASLAPQFHDFGTPITTTEFPAYADKWRRLFAEKGYGARPAPAAMR